MTTTTFRVQPTVLADFKAKAGRNYRTASAELRRLMAEYIEADEQEKAA